MNFFFRYGFIFSTIILFAFSCKKEKNPRITSPPVTPTDPAAPPETWQEHWFDHKQLLSRVYYDSSLAVYFDSDVPRSIIWPNTYLKQVWQYTRSVYGYNFGPSPQLFAIFHAGKYSGGHPAYYFDAGHDYRNVIDCGSSSLTAWSNGTGNDLDLVTHEIGHIVESAAKGTKGSPAFNLWKDSKWMEIYIYDVYKGLGRNADADRWYAMMMNTTDNFPVANTQWFKNWFYPIYQQYGGRSMLNKFFQLLANYFPKDANNRYTRDMNWGEFIHFWSGAAGVNLKTQATAAFGWPSDWETQFNQAKIDFPAISYQ